MTKYKKIEEGKYEIIETKEERTLVDLEVINQNIEHKDKLIEELKNGIADLEQKKADLLDLKNNLLKLK